MTDNYEPRPHPPRAPSPPPSSSSSNVERTQPPSIYPDSVSGVSIDTIPAAYREYNEARQRVPSRGREAVRNSSRHRQPHVREATDGGTERALVPSPALHRPGEYAMGNSPDNSDGRREIEERLIERVHERHVTFENPSTSHEDEDVLVVEEGRRSRESSRNREEDIIVVEEERSTLEHEEDENYDRHWEEPGGGGDWGNSGGGGDGGDDW